MKFDRIRGEVERYYTQKVKTYGATAKGVDWNSAESQELRFEQLLKICDTSGPFSINDYGCGYGALVDFMNNKNYRFQYHGFDISAEMIARAGRLHEALDCCEFSVDASSLGRSDHTVASGIFNVRLQASNQEWLEYILATLAAIDEISAKGFAFNALTSYSNKEYMRPDLYYADPCLLFDHCKTNFSRHVALLHDYGLYEFTILVRK